jgi:hypothetical protein
MVEKVKCTKEGCDRKGKIITTTALFMSKIAPLDGPFPCPNCGEPMKIVQSTPANYKGNSGAKTKPRRAIIMPATKKPVGKKKTFKGIKIKMSNPVLGRRKAAEKPTAKKPGQRKRISGKS